MEEKFYNLRKEKLSKQNINPEVKKEWYNWLHKNWFFFCIGKIIITIVSDFTHKKNMDILIFHMRMEKMRFDKTEGIGETNLSNC